MEGTFIDGKYQVIRQLGQGGMGAVYEARHRSTGRKVAVKVIVPAALAGGLDIIARFQREARASGSIDSPFVVQVLDAGVDPATGAPYMAMECLDGEDVQVSIQRLGPLPSEVVLRIIAHACHGLQKAHDAGIVHRDIKSANLFLARREGDTTEIITKILDFGIAKVRASPLPGEDHKLTKTGSMLGSPVYMSPEQAIGASDLDARSDIFSLGVTMYEALAGVTPNGHLENLGALLMAICSQPAPPIQDRAPWVAPEIAAIVHKALATKPVDRYQSASELRAAVMGLLPNGTNLPVGLLAPIADQVRSHRATRMPTTDQSAYAMTVAPPETSPSQPGSGLAPAHVANAASGAHSGPVPRPYPISTTAGLGVSDMPPTGGGSRALRVGGALAAIAVVLSAGGGGLYLARSRFAPAAAIGAVPSGNPDSASAASSSPIPTRVERTEMVTISPPDATVEVDGKSVPVTIGRFPVIGAVGSVHEVRLLHGAADKKVSVVIAESGPVPPHVEIAAAVLPVVQARPGGGGGGPRLSGGAAVAQPAPAQPALAQPALAQPAPVRPPVEPSPPASPPAKTPAPGPTLDRKM